MDSTSAPGDHTTIDMVSRTDIYLKTLTAMSYVHDWVTNATATLATLQTAIDSAVTLDGSGNLALPAGGTLKLATSPSSSACRGSGAVLALGGTKTVTTSCAASTSFITITRTASGGVAGQATVAAASGSFTITSGALDTSTFSWMIFN
jgi:hypothetical protein